MSRKHRSDKQVYGPTAAKNRVLRLLVNAGKMDYLDFMVDGGLAALVIARYLHRRGDGVNGAASGADSKTIREIRDRFSAVVRRQERIIPTLEEVSLLLGKEPLTPSA